MTFDSNHYRAGYVGHKRRTVVQRASCSNGLYLAPTANATVDSTQPLTITWDTSCFNPAPTAIDIYMTAPLISNPNIHSWTSVDYAKGTISVDLKPKWWNSTSSISMQLNIVQSGSPSFLTEFPAAPLFSVTYDASAAATNSQVAAAANTNVPDSPYTSVNNIYHGGGLSKGQLGAAVLMPLLAVLVGLGIYVKISRAKEVKKRQRWSQAVDKRMSTISGDWKSITPAGASAAIRQSMALSGGDRGTKASSFFAGYGPSPVGRPSSTFTTNEAGLGARYGGVGLGGSMASADGAEGTPIRRPPTIASDPSARVSRVSFAADTRPPRPSMGDSLRTSIYTNGTSRASRAYHRGTVYGEDEDVPPVPTRQDDMTLSPTQTDGPAPLTPQEIKAKIGAEAFAPRPSVDELMRMPAVSLIRTQEGSNELVLPPTPPAPVVTYPVVPTPASALVPTPAPARMRASFGMATLNDAPTGAMASPDEMLKAYALAKKKSVSPIPKRGNTVETTTSANGGMRILYAPADESPHGDDAYGGYTTSYYGNGGHDHSDSYTGTVVSEEAVITTAALRNPRGKDNNPFRKSLAVSRAFTDISYIEEEGTGEAH